LENIENKKTSVKFENFEKNGKVWKKIKNKVNFKK